MKASTKKTTKEAERGIKGKQRSMIPCRGKPEVIKILVNKMMESLTIRIYSFF